MIEAVNARELTLQADAKQDEYKQLFKAVEDTDSAALSQAVELFALHHDEIMNTAHKYYDDPSYPLRAALSCAMRDFLVFNKQCAEHEAVANTQNLATRRSRGSFHKQSDHEKRTSIPKKKRATI